MSSQVDQTGDLLLAERLQDDGPILPALAGEAEPVEGLVVHHGEAVLGQVVVGVERMPGGEGHHVAGVPGPGGAGVVSCQPPASLPSPGLDQLGEERGEQFTDQVSQILSVRKSVFFRIIRVGNPHVANILYL